MPAIGDGVRVCNYATSLVAQETISRGLIVYDDGTGIALVDGPTNQATTETTKILGVALNDAASGEVVSVAVQGVVEVKAGANGMAVGEGVAAEYNTAEGEGIDSGSLTIAAGDWVLGTCVKAAASGDFGLVELNIRQEEA